MSFVVNIKNKKLKSHKMLNTLKKFFTSEKLYKDLNTDNFKALITKNAIIIDVRTPDEYKSGKISKSKNINVASFDFMKQVEPLDKNKDILVYCRSGARSARACKMLTKLGFTKTYNLSGGVMAWQNHGNKLV